MTMSLEEVSQHEPRVIDLRDHLALINGKCAHAVEAFEGTRYSLVLYTQSKYGRMSGNDIEVLKTKGYVWPDPDGIGLSLSQYYQPKGYQRLKDGKAQI